MNQTLDAVLRKICAGFVFLFGLWTVLANIVVHFGQSFNVLRSLTPFVVAASIAIAVAHRKWKRHSENCEPAAMPGTQDGDFSSGWKNLAGLAAVGLLATGHALGLPWILTWAAAACFLVVAWLAHIKAPTPVILPTRCRRSDLVLLVFAIGIAVTASLAIHRPDLDDSLYLNMSVSVLDAPEQPIWETDTLHDVPGAFYLPTYRIHSYELLVALLADLAGLEPISVAHLILPPLFALLAICAAARLLRILLPADWARATLMLTIVLVMARQTHLIYGSFGFVRLFQGKSVFVTLAVLLIVTFATEFSVRPRWATWAMLALAQICAVGLTANALYSAPLAAGITLFACWRPSRWATGKLMWGLLASFYPLLAGLLIRAKILSQGLNMSGVGESLSTARAVELFFGAGAGSWVWIASFAGAGLTLADAARRRWFFGIAAGSAVLFLNPFLDTFWTLHVTGSHLLWRLFWAVPIPIFLAVFLTRATRPGFLRNPVAGSFAFLAVTTLVCLYGQIWPSMNYSGENVRFPGLKVPADDYATAQLLGALAGTGEVVLACEDVAAWVPTLRGHPYPVVARRIYTLGQLRVFSDWIDRETLRDRLLLFDYVSGGKRTPGSAALLARSIESLGIKAVAVPSQLAWGDEVSAILKQKGFLLETSRGYLVFYRGDDWPPGVLDEQTPVASHLSS